MHKIDNSTNALSFAKFTRLPTGKFSLVLINLYVFSPFLCDYDPHMSVVVAGEFATRIYKYIRIRPYECLTIDLTNVSECLNTCACVRLYLYTSVSLEQGVSGISGYENPFSK